MNEPEVKFCSNCKHEVPSGNFMMHHIHCQRKLALCQKCNEPFPHSELTSHISNVHAMVSCTECGIDMEKLNLAEHKKFECSRRSICCAYCHIEIEACELLEHENYCGSRTERCDECGEFVMLKYQQLHRDSNHGFLKLEDEPGPTPLWSSSRATPSVLNDLSRQRKISNASQDPTRPTSALNRLSPSKRTNDMPQVNSASTATKPKALHKTTLPQGNKFDEEAVDLDLLLALRLQDQENARMTSNSGPSAPPDRVLREPRATGGELVALPCEFCAAMIPANQLVLHEAGCRPEMPSPVKMPLRKIKKEPDVLVEGLPCEFCGELFPPHLLLEHEDSCEVTVAIQESMHVNKLGLNPPTMHGIKKRVNMDPPSLFPTRSGFTSSFENEDKSPYLMEVRAALKKPTANVQPLGSRLSTTAVTSNRGDLSSSFVNGYPRHGSSTGAVPKQKAGKQSGIREIPQEVSRSPASSLASTVRQKDLGNNNPR